MGFRHMFRHVIPEFSTYLVYISYLYFRHFVLKYSEYFSTKCRLKLIYPVRKP